MNPLVDIDVLYQKIRACWAWNCWDLVTSPGWPGEFQEVGLSSSCQGSCDAEFSEATSLEAHSYRGSPSGWKSICVISKAFLQILPSMNCRHQVVKHARSGNVQTLGPRLIWAWIMLAFRWRLVTMITFDAGGLQQLGSTHFWEIADTIDGHGLIITASTEGKTILCMVPDQLSLRKLVRERSQWWQAKVASGSQRMLHSFYAACLGKKSEPRVHTDTWSSALIVIVTSITRTCCECHEDAVARWANKAGSQRGVLESSWPRLGTWAHVRLDIIYNHFETLTAWIPGFCQLFLAQNTWEKCGLSTRRTQAMFHETMKLSELRATAEIRTCGRSDMNSRWWPLEQNGMVSMHLLRCRLRVDSLSSVNLLALSKCLNLTWHASYTSHEPEYRFCGWHPFSAAWKCMKYHQLEEFNKFRSLGANRPIIQAVTANWSTCCYFPLLQWCTSPQMSARQPSAHVLRWFKEKGSLYTFFIKKWCSKPRQAHRSVLNRSNVAVHGAILTFFFTFHRTLRRIAVAFGITRSLTFCIFLQFCCILPGTKLFRAQCQAFESILKAGLRADSQWNNTSEQATRLSETRSKTLRATRDSLEFIDDSWLLPDCEQPETARSSLIQSWSAVASHVSQAVHDGQEAELADLTVNPTCLSRCLLKLL